MVYDPPAVVDIKAHPGEIQILPDQLESAFQLCVGLQLADQASRIRRPWRNAGAMPAAGLRVGMWNIGECREVVDLGHYQKAALENWHVTPTHSS